MADKLAVIIPGIGYTKDRPLLYYSAKYLKSLGYEIVHIAFSDMPKDIMHDDEGKLLAVKLACAQTAEQLSKVSFDSYSDVVFVGKSLGTIAAAKYVSDNALPARQIWLTPVEKTFSFSSKDVLAFIGDADPWSDFSVIKKSAAEMSIPLCVIEGADHSLEVGNISKNISINNTIVTEIGKFLCSMHDKSATVVS